MSGADKGSGREREAGSETATEPISLPFPVVGIGASAGGLEAFTQLLEHLPPDTGMAFVLIQHLAPQHKTILPEILARSTPMPVVQVEDGMPVQANHVYVIPPGSDMTIFHGRLNLLKRASVSGQHLPIDYFLRSLALDQRQRAIGIVLSGTASDGSLGLTAVKAEGGITFAQDSASARYEGMPLAAVKAGGVDTVLAPAAIAEELTRLGRHPYVLHEDAAVEDRLPPEESDEDCLNKAFVILRSVFGVDFSGYRRSTLKRRIARRMALLRIDSLREYVGYLHQHPDEVEGLYYDILIMVTEFFREPESFAALETEVLPQILASKNDGDVIRIWVPGCSSGEEAYSIALTVTRVLRQSGRDLLVKVFATDISERDIERARGGQYPADRLQEVPDEHRSYFSIVDGAYQISKSIRDLIIFARHDITRDPPFSQLDLISCRNLLIYLDAETQERVIPVFHYALKPSAYLMLGSSESIGSHSTLFEPVDKKHKIFTRLPGASRRELGFAVPGVSHHAQAEAGDRPELVGPKRPRGLDPHRIADDLLLDRFTPASVVDAHYEILQFRGQTEQFIKRQEGPATLNLLSLVRPGLAPEVRRLIDKLRTGSEQTVRGRARYREDGAVREVDVEAVSLDLAEAPCFLVLFRLAEPVALPEISPSDRGTIVGAGIRVQEQREMAELRREIEDLREQGRFLLQDKEVAVEEVRAANEEIQSSNEELQSINEELETAKEELQSSNEELRTVNEELERRNLQLSSANDDLSNLLRAVNVPTIMVGRDLRIRHYTPGAEQVMRLIPSDIGRPITDIALRLRVPDLEKLITDSIEDIKIDRREVADDAGRWYAMTVRPYQTQENRIEGAVITLIDVDELRTALTVAARADRLNDALGRMLGGLQDGDAAEAQGSLVAEVVATLHADGGLLLVAGEQGWVIRSAEGRQKELVGTALPAGDLPRAVTEASDPTRLDAAELQLPAPLGDLEPKVLVTAPFSSQGGRAGVLLLTWLDASIELTAAHLDFAGKVAALVALAQRTQG